MVFFHQQSPCTWSLPCLYEQDTLWAKYGGDCQFPKSYKWKSWTYKHAHWARCCQLPLLKLNFKLLDKQRTWVTLSSESPSQEAQLSRSPPLGSDDAPKEWTWQEVLFRGLKTLNPRREVKSVVIYIYLFSFACISFPFCILTFSHCIIIFPLAYLLFYISNALEKKIKIFVCLAAS